MIKTSYMVINLHKSRDQAIINVFTCHCYWLYFIGSKSQMRLQVWLQKLHLLILIIGIFPADAAVYVRLFYDIDFNMLTSSNENIFHVTVPLVTSGFPSQRPVTQSFDVFFIILQLSPRIFLWNKQMSTSLFLSIACLDKKDTTSKEKRITFTNMYISNKESLHLLLHNISA